VSYSRPSLPEVQRAIGDALARGRRRLVDVAQILCTSESTVQRSLADCGTDFTSLRKEVQVRIALENLTAGRPVWAAADRAVLSPDHLCVAIKEATGLTPLQIVRAAEISATLDRWRRQGPPAFGSLLYRRQFEQWQKFDAHLQELFADLGPKHPLADWAKKTLLAAERPDFRTRRYRDDRRRKADREAAQLERLLNSARAGITPIPSPSLSSILDEVFAGDPS
jgi:AraC-like DNA-binding protein